MSHSPTPSSAPATGHASRLPAPAPPPRRTPTSRASWTEYQRLLTAGVHPAAATILATGTPPPTTDETAYWRHLANHRTPRPEARAAHAAAQRARRQAS